MQAAHVRFITLFPKLWCREWYLVARRYRWLWWDPQIIMIYKHSGMRSSFFWCVTCVVGILFLFHFWWRSKIPRPRRNCRSIRHRFVAVSAVRRRYVSIPSLACCSFVRLPFGMRSADRRCTFLGPAAAYSHWSKILLTFHCYFRKHSVTVYNRLLLPVNKEGVKLILSEIYEFPISKYDYWSLAALFILNAFPHAILYLSAVILYFINPIT